MTYTTPELLTVGSAADLVLEGVSEPGGPACGLPSDSGATLSDFLENW